MIQWKLGPLKYEFRNLNSLLPHEHPSSWRIWKIANAMRQNEMIPLISIDDDGTILDGHGRYYAARRVLGKHAIIPVQVSYPRQQKGW